ncbi:MAG TPA: hypothetical protein VFA20_09910 [Myxococcaceae bacterium]|nr:hypothetical protein [Myxococcaceae bacterium]
MKRRGLLKGMGVAAAASLWPGWLSEAFAGPPCGVRKGAVTLSAAIQRAHAASRPLLVFTIPADDGEKWDRGRHFGEYLNHGSDHDLAPLACTEVVCAELKTLSQLIPSATGPLAPADPRENEPVISFADVERSPARIAHALLSFKQHDAMYDRLAELPGLEGLSEEERRQAYTAHWAEQQAREEQGIDDCIRQTSAAIRAAVFGDSAWAKRRADATWDKLTGSDRELARKMMAGGEGTPEQVLALAPVLAVSAEATGDPRLEKLLATAARARYCAQRIPGSKWADASGCGETVEGEDDNLAFGCGMGRVPARSQRFLYFFTRSPYAPPTEE